ncbi:imidazolonepropionase [Pelotomaculum propionicicum]|uniref:imidazolonepropionase n=1 Tax=Pelotomaculum propionicicum TaxID=258475 RepID=UPI003B788D59
MAAGDRADLVLVNAGQLVTVAGSSGAPKRGDDLASIGVIEDGAVAVRGGRITAVGTTREVLERVETGPSTKILDAAGLVVLPGLVDPHTHLVFAGSREDEFVLKIQGASYLEILKDGGGILSTVRAVRSASKERLYHSARKNLDVMLCQGTTTAEVKSGYGLTTADELKMLEVIDDLNRSHPVDLAPTFLGAHAVPLEYKDNLEGYLSLIMDEMLPAAAGRGLAEFCDVFCEEGVFSVGQSRQILQAAIELGLKPKIHADEIVSLGGAELAAAVGAVSADHLMAVSDEGVRVLARSGTVAVLLPATTFCLMSGRYAPARKMIGEGVAVALASDFNPGSCPVNSLQVVMGIACRQLKMTPAEVISAATINAAHAIGRGHYIGSIEAGKKADLVVFDAPSYNYLPYCFGTNLVKTVVKNGEIVVGGQM